MASARGVLCLPRKTLAHWPFASRKSPKWRGIVLRSDVTKDPILLSGEGRHLGVGYAFSLASWAERKSIVDSRRKHPLTIALWRLASARKRIIGQDFAASALPQAGLLPQTSS
jgi:hypothetical protein